MTHAKCFTSSMPTPHHHYLYGHRLETMPWHGITAENPPPAIVKRWWRRHHWPSGALYTLLLVAAAIVAGSTHTVQVDTLAHVGIGVVALGCGTVGRRVCDHRIHQVAVTVLLLLVEAYASVQLVG